MYLADALRNARDVLPYTVVLGRDGRVATSYVGLIDMQQLESALTALL